MTYREKLKIEHPEKVDPTCGGGCQFCPHTYWPEAEAGDRLYCKNGSSTACDKCWDREIPETTYFGSIEFCDGQSVRITEYNVREDSTDCLIVNFKSENGGRYTFKKDRKTGEALFLQTFYSCTFRTCDIKKADIMRTNGVRLILVKDEPSLYPKTTMPYNVRATKEYLVLKNELLTTKRKLELEKKRNKLPQIKNVIFNNPATIVFWDDGSKTVVKANGDDAFRPEVGLAMAISKKALGNGSSYFDEFKKWCKDQPKVEDKETLRKSVIRTYLNTANEKIGLALSKTRTTPLDEYTIDKLSDAQLYLSALSSYFENNIEEEVDTLIKVKLTEARVALENVAFYTNKPLKKDLENAIDKALDALMDICEPLEK